jgi:hypothetical protein
MIVKIHESYRKIIAICDDELLGKKFEQGNMQLDVKEDFYGDKKKNEAEVLKLIKDAMAEDATFNFVGKQAVDAGIKAGIISKEGVLKINGIPYALGLL